MISSTFTGNLGNHMWIYAITRSVASHNNFEWGFNPAPEFDYHAGKPQMDFMDINYGILQDYNYNTPPVWCKHVWQERFINFTYENGDTVEFHPFQPEVFGLPDNTILKIRCGQDLRYLLRDQIINEKWFKIKEENEEEYKKQIRALEFSLDEDTTVLNIRGGEYKGLSNLILQKEYWENAIQFMRNRNPKMRFIGISDDVQYATQILDFKIPVVHLSIGGDYYVINNAHNLILSNSSFALLPTWLNENKPFVVAPFGWARHNVTTGYWANSEINLFPWNFLKRDNTIFVGGQNDSI